MAQRASYSPSVTQSQLDTAIAQVVGMPPAQLDTLQEIATQLAADEGAVSALTTLVNTKYALPGGGSTGQYLDGTGALRAFPSIPATQVNSDWNAASGAAQILNKPTLFSGSYSDLSGKPSLSTVATSGSYLDLSNRPTIPAAQIQSDWTQANSSALDFIKNKPTIPAAQVQSDWNSVTAPGAILNKPTVFALATTTPSDVGSAGTVGVATTAARADHVHKGPSLAGGSASTTAILAIGGQVDLVVPISPTMPNTTYQAVAVLTNSSLSLLGTLTVTVKTKATNSVTVTLKNNGLASVAIGQVVEVIALSA